MRAGLVRRAVGPRTTPRTTRVVLVTTSTSRTSPRKPRASLQARTTDIAQWSSTAQRWRSGSPTGSCGMNRTHGKQTLARCVHGQQLHLSVQLCLAAQARFGGNQGRAAKRNTRIRRSFRARYRRRTSDGCRKRRQSPSDPQAGSLRTATSRRCTYQSDDDVPWLSGERSPVSVQYV